MTTTDPTEPARRALVPTMPAKLVARVARGEQVWTAAQLVEDFEVVGFAAPFTAVRRRSDGQLGSVLFTHSPRYYFGWEAHS